MRVVLVREAVEDREIANYVPLVAEGFSVEIVTTTERGTYAGTGLRLPARRLSRRRRPLGTSSVARRLTRAFPATVDPDALVGLRQCLARADVVCVNETHMASSAQASELVRDLSKVRLVTVCYENIPFRYEDDARLARRKDVVRAATDHFIAVTPAAGHALEAEGVEPARITVQPYGVDAERFRPAPSDPRLRAGWNASSDDVVVLYLGRLLQEKGLADLLRAAAQLRHPRLRLVFVGSGPELRRLERMRAALHMEDTATLVPWVQSEAVPRILNAADVFALPSLPTPHWEEQLGFSAIEAMACGLPVLAARGASIPDVVGEAGRYFPPYDVDALAHALRRLVDDAAERARLGALARRRVETSLTTVVAGAQLGSVFRQVGLSRVASSHAAPSNTQASELL